MTLACCVVAQIPGRRPGGAGGACERRRLRGGGCGQCGAAADGRAGAANLINDWAKRTKMPRENYFPGNLGSRR